MLLISESCSCLCLASIEQIFWGEGRGGAGRGLRPGPPRPAPSLAGTTNFLYRYSLNSIVFPLDFCPLLLLDSDASELLLPLLAFRELRLPLLSLDWADLFFAGTKTTKDCSWLLVKSFQKRVVTVYFENIVVKLKYESWEQNAVVASIFTPVQE